MSTSNLMSLPIDIPWQRLATSHDMIDPTFGDRQYPSKWKSSIAVFHYQPPAEEQQYEDRTITYLKVSCTITGFQNEKIGEEARIHPAQLLKQAWEVALWNNYSSLLHPYYPCYGALLQVAVFPKDEAPLEKYPIILDFEPKKREMYESATENKQFLSQSRSNIGSKKGSRTLDRTEMGFNLAGNVGGINAKWGTDTETVDQITTDYSREKRESYSYTTNLTHMYHLLNSYCIVSEPVGDFEGPS